MKHCPSLDSLGDWFAHSSCFSKLYLLSLCQNWKTTNDILKNCLTHQFVWSYSHYGHYLVSALAAERSRGTPGRWVEPVKGLCYFGQKYLKDCKNTSFPRSGEGGHNDSGRSSGSRYRPDITMGTSSIGNISLKVSFPNDFFWSFKILMTVTFPGVSDRRSGKSVDRKSSDSDYSGSGSRRFGDFRF